MNVRKNLQFPVELDLNGTLVMGMIHLILRVNSRSHSHNNLKFMQQYYHRNC